MTIEVHTLTPLLATAGFLGLLVLVGWLTLRGRGAAERSWPEPSARLGRPLSEQGLERAALLPALMFSQQEWVHRRVESFELIDDTAVRRVVSIDFTLPSALEGIQQESTRFGAVPLTVLRKRPLRYFDLRDEDGRPLPLLTREENADLAGDALVGAAETLIEGRLPGDVRRDLRHLTRCSAKEAKARLERWREVAVSEGAAHHPLWRRLCREPGFVDLLSIFADSFVLIADIRPKPGTRRIIKFSYEEPYRHRDNRLARFLSSIGWRAGVIVVDAPAVNAAGSYHLEIAAPEELQFRRAELVFSSASGDPPAPVVDKDAGGRAHLYASDVGPDCEAEARISVLARPEGLLRAGLCTSLLVTALLAGGLWRLDELQREIEGATALLLIIPTVLVAYLVRPGEHALTSRILVGIRGLLVLTAAASIAAAASLVGELCGSTLDAVWIAALIVAGTGLIGLSVSNVLAVATARRR